MLDYLIPDEMIAEGDRVAVGVSGGADSMLLLVSVFEKSKKLDFYFKVISVNHHLRGEESNRDAKFVADFCKKRKIDCEIVDVDVKTLKSDKKKTLEEAARIARYNAINAVMKKDKLSKLFLAHHQNDQAETILMNICRGSGIDGASGIKSGSSIYRPLLVLSKSQILNLCEENKIPFVVDSSNLESNCTRNLFRNVIIPEIEKVYPEAVRSISQFGERCLEIQTYIESLVSEDLIITEKSSVLLREEVFSKPKFLAREYLKRVFENLGIFADIEAKHYKLAFDLLALPVDSSLDFPHQISAKRVHAGIKFYKKSSKIKDIREYSFVVGETLIEGYGKILVEIVSEYNVSYGDGSFYIDYYKVSNDAVWRFRKPGDEFAKLGSGSKKLNDYFTDKKIDTDLRDSIPVLAYGSKVYLVAGYDVGESVKLEGPTDKIAKISFFKN